tara:strand:+ start:258 stop:1181 length:924 start_codon:yes stop_codon:yes gene_type:complete
MTNEFYINQKDWDKMQKYAQAAHDTEKSEIGGMLIAVEDKSGDWELKDPVILKQDISPSNCVLDQTELANYYSKIGAKMGEQNFRFVWWHSHHTMKAFWSATDLAAIQESSDSDFSFALVINLREEYELRVSVWKPFEIHEDVELNIINEAKKISKSILDEVADKCSKITFSYPKTGYAQLGKSNQMTLMTSEYGQNGRPSYNQELSGDTADYVYAYNQVDKMNAKYSDGTLNYEGWIGKANQVNNILKEKWKSIYLIELMTEASLNMECMVATPHEYIYVDAGANYDAEYEDWVDYKSYNASYGVD